MEAYKYNLNVIYNLASCQGDNEDTELSLKFTRLLISKVESWGYTKTYYHDRDTPGLMIMDEVLRVIKDSKFTVVIITPEFGTRSWSEFFIGAALEIKKDKDTIIPIVIGTENERIPNIVELVTFQSKGIPNIVKHIAHLTFEMADCLEETEGNKKEWRKLRQLLDRTKNDGIPRELLDTGERTIEIYKNALKYGEISIYDTRLIVVGPFDVGKTVLTKRLLKIPVDINERKSTNSLEIHGYSPDEYLCVIDVENDLWIHDKDRVTELLSEIRTKAKLLVDYHEKENSEEQDSEMLSVNNDSVEKKSDLETDSVMAGDHSDTIGHTLEEGVTGIVEEKEILPDEELQKVQKHLKEKHVDLGSYGRLSIWDFAGQHLFYSTHQIYFTPRAIYIVVLDMRKSLDDVVKVVIKAKNEQGEEVQKEFSDKVYIDIKGAEDWTYGDFLKFWLNTIYTYGRNAPTLIVATHAGESSEGDMENYKEKIMNYLENLNTDISENISFRNIFCVENSKESPAEYLPIQENIITLAKERTETWGQKIPAKWFLLETEEILSKNSQPLVKVEDIENWCTKEKVDVTTEELISFLEFQHALGKYVYLSSWSNFTKHNERCISNSVVLQPQWIVDTLKCIVTSESFCRKENARIRKGWKELKKNAILTDEVFDVLLGAYKDKHFKFDSSIRDMLLEYLRCLDIVATPPENENQINFIPCMLEKSISEEELQRIHLPSAEPRTPILCIKPNVYIPPAIFNRVISACIGKWQINDDQKGEKQIFCGFVIFDLDDSFKTHLHIMFTNHVIQLQILSKKDITDCVEVRKFICSTISRILKLYKVDEVDEDKHLYVKCSQASLTGKDGMHCVGDLKKQLEYEDIKCKKDGHTHSERPLELLKMWFSDCCEVKKIISTEVRHLPKVWPDGDIMEEEVVVELCSNQNNWNSPDVYQMKKNPRGRALIINNVQFQTLGQRAESKRDAMRLKELFKQLHFEVDVKTNLTQKETLEVFKDEREMEIHKKADCFILVFLSHGNSQGIYTTDGEIISLEELKSEFDGINFRAMEGKPKLIFVQACRIDSSKEKQNKTKADSDEETVHPKSDIFLGNATTFGSKAFRREVVGTWYIQAIIYVFKTRSKQESLYDLMTNVTCLVSKAKSSEEEEVQVSENSGTLRQKFYFFPGLYETG